MAIGCIRRAWQLGAGRWHVLSALGLLSLTGCASLWEDVTSREFKLKNLWTRPDPLVVLRESNDGDKRAKALLALKEPRTHGGGDLEQNTVLQLMNTAATTERQPLVRLAAVQQLGTYKDPRVVPILEDAFYKSGDFPPEIANRIQCRVLMSMGETKNPEVKKFLIDKLKEPTSTDLAQLRNDRCLAAARALGNFPEDPQVAEALFGVFSNDKEDVALRDRAHASLQDVTGERLPAEVAVWQQYLHPQPGQERPHRSRLMELASWVIPEKKEALPRVPTPGTVEPMEGAPKLQTPPASQPAVRDVPPVDLSPRPGPAPNNRPGQPAAQLPPTGRPQLPSNVVASTPALPPTQLQPAGNVVASTPALPAGHLNPSNNAEVASPVLPPAQLQPSDKPIASSASPAGDAPLPLPPAQLQAVGAAPAAN